MEISGDVIDISDSDDDDESVTVPRACSVSESVAFMEVFSPLRIAPECLKLGLTVGPSADQSTGFDFTLDSDRARALALVNTLKPTVLFTCSPCGMFSTLNRMWNFKKWSQEKLHAKMAIANTLFEFGMLLCRIQANNGRYYCHEHPARASSWQKPSVQVLVEQNQGQLCHFHQCRFGLCAPYSLRPIQKATKFITNNSEIHKRFNQKFCKCGKIRHIQIMGHAAGRRLSSHCAIYPKGLCVEVAQAVLATCHCHCQEVID